MLQLVHRLRLRPHFLPVRAIEQIALDDLFVLRRAQQQLLLLARDLQRQLALLGIDPRRLQAAFGVVFDLRLSLRLCQRRRDFRIQALLGLVADLAGIAKLRDHLGLARDVRHHIPSLAVLAIVNHPGRRTSTDRHFKRLNLQGSVAWKPKRFPSLEHPHAEIIASI